MAKKSITFISGFLIPNLNNRTFGNHLKWIDKEKEVFQLQWHHKSGPDWTEEEAEVFVEWDKFKGHYQPDDKMYFTKSKQRFRALLYKLTTDGQIKEIKSNTKNLKIYSIGQLKQGRRKKNFEKTLSTEYKVHVEEKEFDEIKKMLSSADMHEIVSNNNMNIFEDHSYSCAEQTQTFLKESKIKDIGDIGVDCNVDLPPDISFYESNGRLFAKSAFYHGNMNYAIFRDHNILCTEHEVYELNNYVTEEEKENAEDFPYLEISAEKSILLEDVLFSCIDENELNDLL